MEMPELNEDILEGEPNAEMLHQAEESGSLDESALQTEDQAPMDVDSSLQKSEESDDKIQEQGEEGQKNLEESDLVRPNSESNENILKDESNTAGGDGQENNEPLRKKLKLEEDGDGLIQPGLETGLQEPKQEPLPDSGGDVEPEPQSQPPNSEQQPEVTEIKKEEEDKTEQTGTKEGSKAAACPDTDMLATLASAALEQDPKDKIAAAGAATPKSPVTKSETETPKKKPELWCNVGVFDTNTTIVSDYLATPEPNEHVDLVTATLAGRRIQLEPGTAYKFRVCAVNGCGTGPWSDVAAFKTTLPGFPGAPSAIKISKSPEGAHLTWEPPGGNSSEILEYAVYLAVRSASQGCQPVTTNQAQLAFVRVFCGPTNKCMVGTNSLQAAHIDTTTKPAIIFRIAARNSKGYGPATQVRWLQESQNGSSQGVKRAIKT